MFRLAECAKVFPEFFDSVMYRNLATRQQALKRKLAHIRQATRLRERQPVLLEKRQREFLLQFRPTDASRCQHVIWDRHRHRFSIIALRFA